MRADKAVFVASNALHVVDVLVRWAGTAVAVERLGVGESFTIGTGRAQPRHFLWDHAALTAAYHPVVEHRADGVVLRAAPGAALLVDGKVVDAAEVTLARGQRAHVRFGAIEVAVDAGERARPVAVARAVDARFLRISGTSLVLHAGFICALLVARSVDDTAADLDHGRRLVASATPLRAPTVQATPRVEPVRVAPSPALARAQRLKAIAAPSAPRADARTLARAALAALGLDGAGATSVFGASGPSLGGQLRGAQPGGGGDGGVGVRRGPGGVSGEGISLGSLGPLGDGDPDGDIRLIAREKRPVRITVDRFVHEDGLSREEIARVMDRARTQVKACYERELSGTPDLEGKVVLGFTIAASGQVAAASAVANTLGGAAGGRAGACIERVVKRLSFPMPRGGGVVSVTYPFVLAVAG